MEHTEPPDLSESWSSPGSSSESWSSPGSSAESWSEYWPESWSTEEPGSDYDYSSVSLCDRRDVRRFRAGLEPVLFWTVAAVGLVGNLLVLWVYLWRGRGLCGGRGLKALTQLYLLHLCAADLLFLLTLPLWAQREYCGLEPGRRHV
ncbi:hypothetical protein WMY93_031643 [Mugilogobius chulae]|uniref:G-protein coupled receptors family 1 profile domain-containing protein n=1 Tax=Mugilogobius chulae TaxID=88201 RepID=A0AAW0MLK5_9GOBI